MKIIEILVLAVFLTAQDIPIPVIELTNTVARNRLREPTTASASGRTIGYEGGVAPPLPLALELISAKRSQADEASILICEVELRNVSRGDLEIPVDPSSGDLEPASQSTPYRYLTAYIWLAEPGANESISNARLILYGAKALPASLRILKPGQSVRIRAKIPAGNVLRNEPGTGTRPTRTIRAFLALFRESIALQGDGHLHVSMEEIFPRVSSSTTVEVPL